MQKQYYLDAALLPQGWVRGALVSVTDGGHISGVSPGAPASGPALARNSGPAAAHDSGARPPGTVPPDSERIAGIVVPGMPNAHSLSLIHI